MKKIIFYFCVLVLMVFSNISNAGNGDLFKIQASGTGPDFGFTLCLNGLKSISCQHYHASATSLIISTTVPNHSYPKAGIKMDKSGRLLTGCTQSNNGFCIFSTNKNRTANIILGNLKNFTITASNVDTNGSIGPAGNVSVLEGQDQVFTATPNANYGVAYWTVDGQQVQAGGNTYTLPSVSINHSVQVAFSLPSIYLNSSYAVYRCLVNASNGGLENNCTALSQPLGGTGVGLVFETYSSGTYLYYITGGYFMQPDYANIVVCKVDSNDIPVQSTCTSLTGNFSTGLAFMTFQPFAGKTYGYIGDANAYVLKCPMDPDSGQIVGNHCDQLYNPSQVSQFNQVQSVNFASFEGVTYAYIADASATLWQCAMDLNGLITGACNALTSGNATSFYSTSNIAFKTLGGSVYGYVSDGQNFLWQCPMNSNGTFKSACQKLYSGAANDFSAVTQAIIGSVNDVTNIYITDMSQNVWQCQMKNDGTFNSACNSNMISDLAGVVGTGIARMGL